MTSRILIAGGYGVIGSAIARAWRAAHPDLHLILAGRNPDQGTALAKSLGGASTHRLDVMEPEIDLAGADLVVTALYDPANALALAALDRGAAHVGITTKADDIAPIVFAALARPPRRPMVLAGHGMAGVASIVARKLAARFGRLDRVAVTGIFDPADPVGPMTAGDSESLVARALVRDGGRWRWIDGFQNMRRASVGAGEPVKAYPSALLDGPSMAAATGAADVRFDIAPAASLGTRGGRQASSDVHIEMEGRTAAGAPCRLSTVISDPNGIAHLTALGVLVLVERALGLDGRPAAPGALYTPETLVDPDEAIARFERAGVHIFTGAAAETPAMPGDVGISACQVIDG